VVKGRGYAWGLSSVILSACYFVFPLFILKPSSETAAILFSYLQILWVFFPMIGFILAFIGKVRSEWGTKARKLCNIGAGICWVVSVMLMFFGLGALWMDVFSISASAAEITGFVDTVLIAGYFLIAYIRGKILWFI